MPTVIRSVLLVAILVSAALAQDSVRPRETVDLISKVLQKSKQEYSTSLDLAAKVLAKAIDLEIKKLKGNSNSTSTARTDLIAQLQKEQMDFASDSKVLPKSPGLTAAVDRFRTKTVETHRRCITAFEAAATKYQARNEPEKVQEVLQEMKAFLTRVIIPMQHQRQTLNMCVPTCAAMAFDVYDVEFTPVELKRLATPPDSTFEGTYFRDMTRAAQDLGYPWRMVDFPTSDEGGREAIAELRKSLDEGRPVLVDLNVPPVGHTVLVNGYDGFLGTILYVDPNTPAPGQRELSEKEFDTIWRSVISDVRGAIFTAPQ